MNLLKIYRQKKGMTQEDLAEKTELSARTIQRIENGEVDPRAYTIQMIAKALEVDFSIFSESDSVKDSEEQNTENRIWLGLLHLSGLFLLIFPSVLIWNSKKDTIENLNEHFYDVFNFQLSVWIIFFLPGIFSLLTFHTPTAIFGGIILGAIFTVINTIKVFKDQPYKYIILIKFINKRVNLKFQINKPFRALLPSNACGRRRINNKAKTIFI